MPTRGVPGSLRPVPAASPSPCPRIVTNAQTALGATGGDADSERTVGIASWFDGAWLTAVSAEGTVIGIHPTMPRRASALGHHTAPTVTAVMVYLVQHGQAKPADEDPQRPLTARGADDVTWVAHWAVDRFGVRPSRVIHSGKTRSRQTAQIWARLIGVHADEGDSLAPNDDPTTWARRLADEPDDVMVVGHLPHLAKLASLLLTGDPDRQLIGFHQGGLVALEHTDTGWGVALLLPPPTT